MKYKTIGWIIVFVFCISITAMSALALDNTNGFAFYSFESDLLDSGTDGNNFNLRINGTSNHTASKIGDGLDINYHNNISNTSITNAADIRTIDFWVKPQTIAAGNTPLSIGSGTSNAIRFSFDDFNVIKASLTGSTGDDWEISSPVQTIHQQEDSHVVLIMNASGASLYVNNTLVANTVLLGRLDGFTKIFIGSFAGRGDQFWSDAIIDNLFITTKNYSRQDVADSYNGYSGFDFSVGAAAGDLINVSTPSPPNNDQFNYASIFFNATVNSTYDFNCSLFINSTKNETINHTAGTDVFINFTQPFPDGDWLYKIVCYNSTGYGHHQINTTENTFYIDTVIPTITWTTPNAGGTSSFSGGVLVPSITITDDNLYSYHLNITFRTNHSSIWNLSNTSLSGLKSFAIHNPANIGGFEGDLFNYTVKVCDGHTTTTINSFDVSKTSDKITFDDVYIKSKTEPEDITYKKLIDRYSFDFYYATEQTEIQIEVPSYCKYISNSQYRGHFVCEQDEKWIDFEGDYTVTVNKNIVTIKSSTPLKKWSFSSVGEMNCITESKEFSIFSLTQGYEGRVLENQPVLFQLNITFNPASMEDINASLTYNNTIYSPTKIPGASLYRFERTLNAPTISNNNTNVTFNWTYTVYADSSDPNTNDTFNSSLNTQEIYKIGIDNCSSYKTYALNFSLIREYDDTEIAVGDIAWYSEFTRYSITYNYSTESNNHNSTSICMFPKWAEIYADTQVEYIAPGFNTHDYFMFNTTLDNQSSLINLYLVNGTTMVSFLVKDQDYTDIEDAYIKVMKYDVGTGSYQTVEILKTDSDGYAYGEIVLNTVWYKFILEYLGEIVLETTPTKITSTTKTFRINLVEDYFANYDIVQGVTTSLTFTNSTLNFVYTWSDSAGDMHYGCLEVIKRTINGDTMIGESCVLSTASSIIQNIGTDVGDNLYIATGYLKFDEPFITDILEVSFNYLWKVYDTTGIFVSFLLITGMVMVGLWNPIVAIVMMGIGFFVTNILGFLQLEWLWLVGFLILAGIMIYKLGKQ